MDKEIILKIVADNHLIAVAIAIAIAVILSYTLRKFLTKFIANRSDSLNIDPTRYNFMKNASTALIIGAALAFTFYAIPSLRSIGTALFAGAGIAAAAIAFASQQALSNIIGGVFLVIFRPFRVGDIIHVAPVQLADPTVTIAFDTDGETAAKTRARVMDMATTDKLLIAGAHMSFPSVGYLEKADTGYRWFDAPYPYGQ